jgi:crossover junction endodeoxyribonuclease RuvC
VSAPAADSTIRILGIDPGLRVTGFGIIERTGQRLAYVASGCVKVPHSGTLPERIAVILDSLGEVIGTHQPGEVALERVFVNVNPESTLLLGQARGAAISAAVLAKLPVAEYTALQIKQAVVGTGHARKEQVQEMVKRLLRLPGHPSSDAADALACAICHAHGGQGWKGWGGQLASHSPAPGRLAGRAYRVRRGRLA